MSSATPSLFSRVRNWIRPAAKVTSAPAVAAVSRDVRAQRAIGEMRAMQARYDAGQMGGYDRSWLPGYVQDARQDIDPGSRLEMVRKGRYFEQNSATMQKSLDLIETNVVGTGIHCTPAATDSEWTAERLDDWNARALVRWQEWCKYADLTSRQTFETLQALIARAQAVDGEIFIWLTRGEPDEKGRVFPRIQLIETHRVRDAKLPRQYEAEGFTQFDGILTDGRGRPVFYIVSNDADAFSKAAPRSVALIPAEEMVHVFEPSRTSQPRGITLYHACLHDLHDLDDLQKYEMLASKDAASRANIVKTKSGELPADEGNVIGRTEQTTDSTGEAAEKVTFYQTAFGGKTVVMREGDEFSQSTALRPTSAQQEFWKILERKFCRGAGHSYAALCDYEGAWGGAALRATLASDNRFYDVRTQTLVASLQRVYEYVIGFDARPGGALWPAPRNWKQAAWQSPRRATVDIGRESKAILDELEAGVRTERDTQGELGLDWQAVQDQRAAEVERRLAKAAGIAAKFSLPLLGVYALLSRRPSMATDKAPDVQADPPANAPANPDDEPDDDENEDAPKQRNNQ